MRTRRLGRLPRILGACAFVLALSLVSGMGRDTRQPAPSRAAPLLAQQQAVSASYPGTPAYQPQLAPVASKSFMEVMRGAQR